MVFKDYIIFLILLFYNFAKNYFLLCNIRYRAIELDSFIKKTVNPNKICSNSNKSKKENIIKIELYS